MDDLKTPLNGQTFSTDALRLEEIPACTKINLRAESSLIAQAVDATVGLQISADANCYHRHGQHTVYWLGPDEYLLYAGNSDAPQLVTSLSQHLPAGKSAVVDVSDYYTSLRLSGECARAVLASGTPFNVHHNAFAVGECAQTRYGNASVLLSRVNEQTYDLQVRWSFAEYLWQYLTRVARYV